MPATGNGDRGDVDRRLVEAKHDDGVDRLPVGLRHGDLDAVVGLADLYVAAGEKAALDDLRRQRRKPQHVLGPCQNVQVNRIALAGAGEVLGRFVGTAARAVDALAVLGHPRPDLLQPIDLAVFDGAGRLRADVQQHVPVAAGATDQHVQAIGQRFHAVFRPAPRPLIVRRDRHARLPRAIHAGRRRPLARACRNRRRRRCDYS